MIHQTFPPPNIPTIQYEHATKLLVYMTLKAIHQCITNTITGMYMCIPVHANACCVCNDYVIIGVYA